MPNSNLGQIVKNSNYFDYLLVITILLTKRVGNEYNVTWIWADRQQEAEDKGVAQAQAEVPTTM